MSLAFNMNNMYVVVKLSMQLFCVGLVIQKKGRRNSVERRGY